LGAKLNNWLVLYASLSFMLVFFFFFLGDTGILCHREIA
jgi:hypothetical protein